MIHYFKVLILLSITFLNSNRTVGQGIGIESNSGSSYQMFLVPKEIDKSSKEYEKFASKIYLSDTFLSSEIDNFQDKVYLKYNIFKDEMEFINDNKVYYLKKNLGRKIHFFDLNIDFEILIKLVNTSESERAVQVNIKGFSFTPKFTAETLAYDDLNAVNSIDSPEKISTDIQELYWNTKTNSINLPAMSFRILKFRKN